MLSSHNYSVVSWLCSDLKLWINFTFNTFMHSKSGIFIFTRDRPDKLSKIFHSIKDAGHSIVIVDDSVEEASCTANHEIIKSSSHLYFGKLQFSKFIKQYNIDISEFSFLLRQLGDKEWNLGYARNVALVFGRASGFKNVLFMDDDIEIPNLLLIDELFSLLQKYYFTGAHIAGLVDDSVLGHVATDLDIFNERMLSGGFMAFNPNNVAHYFLNNYNEDWIWLFLQNKVKNYFQTGEVMQALSDPLDNYAVKIMFQEFGEIALDGVLDCYKKNPAESLCSLLFWKRMLKERKEYLGTLYEVTKLKGENKYLEIIEYVTKNQNYFNAAMFKNLFEKYFSNLGLFKRLFKSLQ
jgi:hypothetical protein